MDKLSRADFSHYGNKIPSAKFSSPNPSRFLFPSTEYCIEPSRIAINRSILSLVHCHMWQHFPPYFLVTCVWVCLSPGASSFLARRKRPIVPPPAAPNLNSSEWLGTGRESIAKITRPCRHFFWIASDNKLFPILKHMWLIVSCRKRKVSAIYWTETVHPYGLCTKYFWLWRSPTPLIIMA